ncbi:MAG: hypothetical protein ACOYMA_00445 [Bacteroidia bacterium]
MSKLEWNTALQRNEDWDAANSSEVFRNYMKIVASESYKNKVKTANESIEPINLDKEEEVIKEEEATLDSIDDSLEMEDDIVDVEDLDVEDELSEEDTSSDFDDYGELYNTGAGESKYIDIGMTDETESLMETGIDYVEAEVGESFIEVDEAEEDKEEAEIMEAEIALGLNKNINYILSKMGK